jgi:hypothetical protein
MKLLTNFSQRTHLIHSIGPKTNVLGHFGPSRYCTKVNAKLAEQVPLTHTFAKWSFFEIFRNERMWSTPILSIGPKTHVLGRFGPFRYCMKVVAKLAEPVPLMHKFAKQSRVWNFRNERTRSTALDRKLMFWGVSDRFVTARKSWQNWLNKCH